MNNNKLEFQLAIKQLMETSIHTFMRRMHIFAKEQGLSFSQINCLFKMVKHGSLQVNQVSHFFDISNPAASQLLDKLVNMDLVKREESSTDRRVKLHSATKKGEDMVKEFSENVQGVHKSLAESFEPEDYKRNTNFLNTLTNKLVEESNKSMEDKC